MNRTLKVILLLLVLVHLSIVILNILAVFFLAICSPWYISIPLISLLALRACNDWKCPLTVIENVLRDKLNMPRINGFIDHYILKRLGSKVRDTIFCFMDR
jgi:hypothetical protein